VVPAGDRDRAELDRPELAKDLHHGFGASRERPRRREEVPRYEKATRRLSSYLHLEDTNRASVDWQTKYARRHRRRSPIIGGLPAVEGSAWDIGAPLDDRGAGPADEQGSPPGQASERTQAATESQRAAATASPLSPSAPPLS
jgi:hypothetical protein